MISGVKNDIVSIYTNQYTIPTHIVYGSSKENVANSINNTYIEIFYMSYLKI